MGGSGPAPPELVRALSLWYVVFACMGIAGGATLLATC
jgi:hypothetical protein